MSELENKAYQKMDTECETDIDNSALVAIANYMRDRIHGNDALCNLVLDENKTVTGAFNSMGDEAEKRVKVKKGVQRVCISPEEVFRMVDDYYCINSAENTQAAITEVPKTISLFDLI